MADISLYSNRYFEGNKKPYLFNLIYIYSNIKI